MVVTKQVRSLTVEARPRFRGKCEPEYWVAAVNSRVIFRKFKSPDELFRFVEQQYGGSERQGRYHQR